MCGEMDQRCRLELVGVVAGVGAPAGSEFVHSSHQ